MTRPERQTILVAGGAGFIGSHLCAALIRRGHSVLCLDNYASGEPENVRSLCGTRRFRIVRHDVTQPLAIAEPLDRIFNLVRPPAAVDGRADRVRSMLTNILGTRYLLDLAADHKARFVQGSGPRMPMPVATKPGMPVPDDGRGAAEALCRDFLRSGRVDARIVRIGPTYGPRMAADGPVARSIERAIGGDTNPVAVNFEWPLCHVDDVVRGLLALMDRPSVPGLPIVLSHPELCDARGIAAGIRSILAAAPVRHRRGRPAPAVADARLARELLGWTPRVSLEDGLPATIEWFRQRQMSHTAH